MNVVERIKLTLTQSGLAVGPKGDSAYIAYQKYCIENNIEPITEEEYILAPAQAKLEAENAAAQAAAAELAKNEANEAAQTALSISEDTREAASIIVANENVRVENENTRQGNETTRDDNETLRVSAETTRQTNETNRVNAEGDATKGRVKAENDRIAAETAREQAEVTKGQNETTRQNQESTRQEKEGLRQNAETTRIAAEAARNVASNVYNITLAIPLTAGSYYTQTTARAAVPVGIRKRGLELVYETSAGVWYQERFVGSDVANWTAVANWELVPIKSQIETVEEVTAQSLVELNARIDALQKIISEMILGSVQIDNLDIIKTLNLFGKTNLVLSGAAAPAIAPDFLGQFYIKTTATKAAWIATNNTAVGGWLQIG